MQSGGRRKRVELSGEADALTGPLAAINTIVTQLDALHYRRGHVVGGTSAIIAAAAVWPRPDDFERWVALGNTEWNWTEVQPWLRRVEADQDAPDRSIHGTHGPVPIRRFGPDELIPVPCPAVSVPGR